MTDSSIDKIVKSANPNARADPQITFGGTVLALAGLVTSAYGISSNQDQAIAVGLGVTGIGALIVTGNYVSAYLTRFMSEIYNNKNEDF
jgi:hypothetical protein